MANKTEKTTTKSGSAPTAARTVPGQKYLGPHDTRDTCMTCQNPDPAVLGFKTTCNHTFCGKCVTIGYDTSGTSDGRTARYIPLCNVCLVRGPTPIIQVIVDTDEEARAFGVPKNILTSLSSYFDRALDGGFSQSAAQQVNFEDEDPVIFRHALRFMCSGTLHNGNTTLSTTQTTDGLPEMFTCFQIWALADHPLMPQLENYAVWCILTLYDADKHVPFEYSDALYGTIADDGSMMKPLIYDLVCWGTQEWPQGWAPERILVKQKLGIR